VRKKLVEIVWVDIQSDAGWQDLPDKELHPIKTFAILVRKTKTEYLLASTYDSEVKKYGDLHRFPKGVVQSCTVISMVDI